MKTAKDFFENYTTNFSHNSLWLFPSASQTARSLYFYVQECGHFWTNQGYYTERKQLKSFLLLYTLFGRGKLTYLGETHFLTPNTAFFIDCTKHHRYECIFNGSNWEFLWIHFNAPLALGYYQETVKNGFHLYESSGSDGMKEAFEEIIESHQSPDVLTEPRVSGILTKIITMFLLDSCKPTENYVSFPEHVQEIVLYMEKHFRESLTLDDFAVLCHMSKFHLSHEFKKYMGIPINEYLILKRISYSKELLRFSLLSVEEISYECGFSNPGYFIRIFKKREKITPGHFRELWSVSP